MTRKLSIADYSSIAKEMDNLSISESVLLKAILDIGTSHASFDCDNNIEWAIVCDRNSDKNYIYYVIVNSECEVEAFSSLFNEILDEKITYATRQVMFALRIENIDDPEINDTWSKLDVALVDRARVKLRKVEIHPELKRGMRMIKPMALRKHDSIKKNNQFDYNMEQLGLKYFKRLVKDINDCKNYTSSVYSFPVFTENYCKYLVDKMKDAKYIENNIEAEMYQIPEFVLDQESSEFKMFADIVFNYINNISTMVYHQKTEDISSIQFARYSKDTTSNGNLHSDQDSDITIVINLSDKFDGGGTRLLLPGFDNEIVIPPVPVGHCLLFRGRMELHEGMKITSGTRDLLVFWTTT